MAAAQAPSRTRRYVYGGLLTAAAVAIGLALVFTVGGKKEAKAATTPAVSSLDDTAPGIADVLKDLTKEVTPEAPVTVTPVAPAAPAAPQAAEGTFTTNDKNNFVSSLQNAKNNFGDPLQAAALFDKSSEHLKDYVGSAACWPQDGDELKAAVEEQDCPLVVLTNGDPDAYALEDAIEVTRSVRVMGNPAVLPTIDGSEAVRCFTVGVGGFLELSFVRTKQGGGVTRPRLFLEDMLPDTATVTEIRGGAVAVEPGAIGANFVGVVFTAIANDIESVQDAIESTLNFEGGRIYGGHVFVAAGTVNFFGCNFWDTVLIIPLTDQVSIGGDVLVVGGNVFFTGCIFTASMIFGNFGGLGFNVGVLGGNMIMTFCVIQAQGVAESANGAGQVLFVGGGTMILTGVDFRFASACLLFTGIGDFFVGGGVMVFTGVTIENAYPILAAYGAGFYLAVGGGVMVQTGVTYVQFNGPAHLALTGASIFTGAGISLHTGVPASFYGTTVLFTGQGGYSYLGAGYSMWLGCPIAVFAATFAFFGLGGLMSQPAGFTVYIGNPAFVPAAIVYFAGAGVVLFLGAGGAVIGGSPVYAPAFIFRGTATPGGEGANYYVNGNQEYANGIGYFDKTGRYGYFYDREPKNKTAKVDEPKNKTRAVMVTDKEAFDGAIRKLKSERKLSIAGVNSVLNHFSMSGGSSLVGVDLKYQTEMGDLKKGGALWDSLSAEKDGWVAPAILSAAQEIQSLKNSFGNLNMRSRGLQAGETVVRVLDEAESVDYSKDRPMVGVGSEMNVCGVCGDVDADHIAGPYAEECTPYESCEGFRQVAPEGTEAAFDWKEMAFDPWYIVQGNMIPASNDKFDIDAFRTGLRSYFVATDQPGVQVTAYSTEPDALFKAMVPNLDIPALSKALDAANPVSTPMKVAFLVNDKEQAASIKKALNDPNSQEHEDMLNYMQDYMGEDEVTIGGLDSSHEKDVFIPGYNTPEFAKAFEAEANAAAGANSVRLVEAGKEGLPLSHAAQGATYKIQMANFPAGVTELTATLIGSQLVGGAAKQTAVPLGVAKVEGGMASIEWIVPRDTPAGSYYIKATDATGAIFGMTPAIDVVAAARRKLYGPLMEL